MPQLSRRQFLGLGASSVGLLAAAWHGVGHLGSYPPVPFDAVTLTPKTAAVFTVLGDWLLPPGGDLPGSGGDQETLRLIDQVVTSLPPHHQMLMLALPLAFEHGTALDRFGADRLTSMSAADQSRYLDDWFFGDSVVRNQLITAVKMVWNMTYLERSDVQRAMGIPMVCGLLP